VPVNVLFEYYYFYSLTPHNAGKLHKKRHKGEWNYIFLTSFSEFWRANVASIEKMWLINKALLKW